MSWERLVRSSSFGSPATSSQARKPKETIFCLSLHNTACVGRTHSRNKKSRTTKTRGQKKCTCKLVVAEVQLPQLDKSSQLLRDGACEGKVHKTLADNNEKYFPDLPEHLLTHV